MRPFRVFLITALLLATPLFAQERVRKHVCDLTDAEWTALDHAFQTLQALPSGSANNYITWADIHGFPPNGPCKHNSEQVWTWHRAYLYWFENALRASDPPSTANVTLPYWDWTQPPTGDHYPIQFETMPGLLPPAAQCPTISACRDTSVTTLPPFSPSLMASIQAIPDWGTYGGKASGTGQLEFQPHNSIHGTYIEGLNFSNAEAARDPVFWAHHSNLDRLWTEWQAAARAAGREPGPVNKTFPINFLSGKPHSLSGDYADVAGWMNYSYRPQQKQCKSKGLTQEAAPKKKLALLNVVMPKPSSVVELPVSGVSPSAAERLILRFHDVTRATDASYVIRVYLRPAGSDPAKRSDADLLTFFALWRSSHEHGDAEQSDTFDISLDVTDRYRALTAGSSAKRVLVIDIDKRGAHEAITTSRFGEPVRWSSVSIEEVSSPKQTVK